MTIHTIRRVSRIGGLLFFVTCLIAVALTAMESAGQTKPVADNTVRHIWVFSDSHVGLTKNNDGKDGGDWLQLAIQDVRQKMGGADYVLGLGDLVNSSAPAEFRRYLDIRSKSGIKTWFEINGNHDYAASTQPAWKENLRTPPDYVIEDGNCVFIMLSSEQGNAAGRISPSTFDWLKTSITRYQDHNVFVCSHQAIYDTVDKSTKAYNYLYVSAPTHTREYEQMLDAMKTGREAMAKLLSTLRVDVWLCGHIHSGKRTAAYVCKKGSTTFINVSTTGHAYGTGMSSSYLLELTDGSTELRARCRDHDTGAYIEDQSVKVDLPYEVHLSPSGPHIVKPATQPAQ